MISAIDTNILIDVLGRPNKYTAASVAALNKAMTQGSLVICPIVAAELSVNFRDAQEMQEILGRMQVKLSETTWETLHLAGKICWNYRKVSTQPKDRLLADFWVAAHASVQADQLLTRDRGYYRFYFPKLRIVEVQPDAQ